MTIEVDPDALAHFGVKGMRWGVRKDDKVGDSGKVETTKPKHPASEDFTRARASQAKGADALSTKELQELVTRMNLEQQYSKLTSGPEVKKGKSFVEKALEQFAQEQTKKLIGLVATAVGRAILNAVMGSGKIPPNMLSIMEKLK